MPQKLVMISDGAITSAIFGTGDENARRIEERFSVRIEARSGGADSGECLAISGEDAHLVEKAGRVLEYLSRMVTAGDYLEDQTVDYVIETISADAAEDLEQLDGAVVAITSRGKPIKPKTAGQRRYVEAIRKNTVTFGLGPAGTGKTFLAVAMAVEALRSKQADRIILYIRVASTITKLNNLKY